MTVLQRPLLYVDIDLYASWMNRFLLGRSLVGKCVVFSRHSMYETG